MIQLLALPRPDKLTDALVKQLTDRYQKTGERVWIQSFIKENLLKMSHDKCVFCECNIAEESKYMEVEHYVAKSIDPSKVVDWANLLPACKRCNGCKSDHNVLLFPIIHPVHDKPTEHLKLFLYFFKPKTLIGKTTITVLDLNNIRVRQPRAAIGLATTAQLEDLNDEIEQYEEMPSPNKRNKIRSWLYNIMLEAQPNSAYSATVATVIWRNSAYRFAKDFFQKQNWWTSELQQLEQAIELNAFDIN